MDKSITYETIMQENHNRRHNHSRRLIVSGVAVLLVVLLLPLVASAQAGEQAPTAPSGVEVVNVTLRNGTTGIQLRWIDTADNEMGFRAVDQRSGQEYDALPNTGPTGSIVSITLPLASGCFRIFAYNNYGASPLSDMVCTPQGYLPATGGDRRAWAVLPIVALVLAITFLAAGVTVRRRSTASKQACSVEAASSALSTHAIRGDQQ